MKGESEVRTNIGGISTILVILMVLSYALNKLVILIDRKDVSITEHRDISVYPLTKTVNVNEIGFRMAFTVENYLDNKLINDPRYVKWYLRMYAKRNGEWYQEMLPYHTCTQADFDSFAPLTKVTGAKLHDMTQDRRPMFCLDDWPEDMILGGDK